MCFSGHEEPSKSKAANVATPKCVRPSQAARAWTCRRTLARPERSAGLTLNHSVDPRFSGSGKQLVLAAEDLCAPRANARYHQALVGVLCARRHPGKRGSGQFCTETLLTGDDGGNEKPMHVKLVRPLSWWLCGRRDDCKTQKLQWSRDWSCAKLVGRTLGCATWTTPDYLWKLALANTV